ncbi:hypothetical protein COEREDRAFT_12105, partial [Coemansia reversa NRRL 1564]
RRRLGYDETITWLDGLNCYEIEVPSGTVPGDHVKYYSSSFIRGADHLFGRHCRCLLATPIRPTIPVSDEAPIKPTVVIKDSWTIYSLKMERVAATSVAQTEAKLCANNNDGASGSADITTDMSRLQVQKDLQSCVWPSVDVLQDVYHISGLRNEYALLHTINSSLSRDKDLDGIYPKAENGGWVYQPTYREPVLDCTLEVTGILSADDQKMTPFCLHGRHTLAPIGQPLRTVKSTPELITVLYDAMRCHSAIFEKCQILHRDISENNILAVRNSDGSVHGLLIDFDCAEEISAQKLSTRPERTGTFPFMSIANLENLPIERTVLDDWESLLYLICVMAFHEVGSNDSIVYKARHPMRAWTEGESNDIGQAKRGHLDTMDTFLDDVLEHFKHQNGYEDLYILAMNLHKNLFANERLKDHPNNACHGARKKRVWIGNNKHDIPECLRIDPFAERVKYALEIARDLLNVLASATKIANNAN